MIPIIVAILIIMVGFGLAHAAKKVFDNDPFDVFDYEDMLAEPEELDASSR